ncbi:hypothetical protein TCE0_018r06121 [Talaromyces pinophilus]|uniref:Uncharacterized protein n=1 Tax=Talaromyces pinophilus TaxID=128442 RepID=A0A510NWZ0_TALPI|nr:hypothetical protein TCE0_018r06121 [Talaromyces pinophilus]
MSKRSKTNSPTTQLYSVRKQLAYILNELAQEDVTIDEQHPGFLRYDRENDKLYLVDVTHWSSNTMARRWTLNARHGDLIRPAEIPPKTPPYTVSLVDHLSVLEYVFCILLKTSRRCIGHLGLLAFLGDHKNAKTSRYYLDLADCLNVLHHKDHKTRR